MSNRHEEKSPVLSEDEAIVKQALDHHFDAEVESLDFNVTSKLAAARSRALAQETGNPVWQNLFGWQTAVGGVAAVTVAYVISSQVLNPTPALTPNKDTPVIADTSSSILMEDITILAEGDDIEFYQNIEFLEWLESNS